MHNHVSPHVMQHALGGHLVTGIERSHGDSYCPHVGDGSATVTHIVFGDYLRSAKCGFVLRRYDKQPDE